MTTSNASTLAPTDPRATLATAVRTAGAVIAGVGDDQRGLPTPCEAYDVDDLTGHLVSVLHRVALLGEGGNPFDAPEIADTPADGWSALWERRAHQCRAAWSDDAKLERLFSLPWVQCPGAGMLDKYTSEITVHTWDLATATGQTPEWDERTLEVAFASIQRSLPAEGRAAMFDQVRANMPAGEEGFEPPYGAAVEVPQDAPLLDRLVAWNGRQPLR